MPSQPLTRAKSACSTSETSRARCLTDCLSTPGDHQSRLRQSEIRLDPPRTLHAVAAAWNAAAGASALNIAAVRLGETTCAGYFSTCQAHRSGIGAVRRLRGLPHVLRCISSVLSARALRQFADVRGSRLSEDQDDSYQRRHSMSATEKLRSPTDGAVATYRAAVVHDFAGELTIDEVPFVALGPGQIRVKVEPTGLCHTDIPAAHGDWPVKPTPPFVPGHEGVGIVVELAPGVTEVEIGDRVAMPWLGYACGVCDYCVSGWETLCLEQKNMGYSIDGGFGEYATAYARYVVKVPEGVDPFDAAPLTCAGVTTYKAVKVAGTRPSDLVAVDLHDDKLELARTLGAEVTINAAKEDPVAAIQALGGVDQAIALAV